MLQAADMQRALQAAEEAAREQQAAATEQVCVCLCAKLALCYTSLTQHPSSHLFLSLCLPLLAPTPHQQQAHTTNTHHACRSMHSSVS